MGQPAARLSDMTACPMVSPAVPPVPHGGGPITGPCAVNVLIGGLPAARVGDVSVCVGPPATIVNGSPTVIIAGSLAARLGDPTSHGGTIVTGQPTVLIGGSGGGGGGGGGMASFNITDQVAALENAAADGLPFCEQCQIGGSGG